MYLLMVSIFSGYFIDLNLIETSEVFKIQEVLNSSEFLLLITLILIETIFKIKALNNIIDLNEFR